MRSLLTIDPKRGAIAVSPPSAPSAFGVVWISTPPNLLRPTDVPTEIATADPKNPRSVFRSRPFFCSQLFFLHVDLTPVRTQHAGARCWVLGAGDRPAAKATRPSRRAAWRADTLRGASAFAPPCGMRRWCCTRRRCRACFIFACAEEKRRLWLWGVAPAGLRALYHNRCNIRTRRGIAYPGLL